MHKLMLTALMAALIVLPGCAAIRGVVPTVTVSGPGYSFNSDVVVDAVCHPINALVVNLLGQIPQIGPVLADALGPCEKE